MNLNTFHTNNCNYLKYIKSNYAKETYSELLLANENTILFYKKLIKKSNDVYYKYYYSKLLINHAKLIKRNINKIEELLGYLCKTTKINIINDLKHDLLILHIFKYNSYKNALNVLSEIKIFYTNLHKYDIENQINMLHYEINLSKIEYVKTKLNNNNMFDKVKKIEKILYDYENTHNDNLLKEIIEIESFTNIKMNNNDLSILLILLLLFIVYYFKKIEN